MKVLGIKSYGFEPLTDNPTFHPGRTASLIVNGKKVGVIGLFILMLPEILMRRKTPVFLILKSKR